MARPAPTALYTLAGWLVLASGIFTYYLGLATGFAYDIWPTTSGGFVFNSQLRSLLEGRLDIDPRIIGNEAFVRDGKTYTYFGIWPALLRLPLVNQLWRDWTLLSCVCAATLAALALIAASRPSRVMDTPIARAFVFLLAVSFVLSGPQIELLGKPSVYVEAVLWAYASACVFLYASLPVLLGRPLSARRLSALAACAAIALLARVSTGLALYAAFASLVCLLVWHRGIEPGAWRAQWRRFGPAVALLLAAVFVTLTINQQRWGSALEFAPLPLNKYYAADPSRLARLARHGVFSPARIPDALSYYAAPAWFFAAPPDSARATRVATLFDGPEGPPIGVPQSQGLWLALALLGVWACTTGRLAMAQRRAIVAVAAGLAVGPLLITSYHYLAFRYRAEFAPLILLFALIGLHALRVRLARLNAPLQVLVFVLTLAVCAAQILQAHAALRAYTCTPMGSYWAARWEASVCLSLPGAKRFKGETHKGGRVD